MEKKVAYDTHRSAGCIHRSDKLAIAPGNEEKSFQKGLGGKKTGSAEAVQGKEYHSPAADGGDLRAGFFCQAAGSGYAMGRYRCERGCSTFRNT